MGREEILKSVNYRQQEIKCCEGCNKSYFIYHDFNLYCQLLNNISGTNGRIVDHLSICDKYEG